MNMVMVMAYAAVSPLILPFGLLYFVLIWAVWRYQASLRLEPLDQSPFFRVPAP